jgi:hypothetical protein
MAAGELALFGGDRARDLQVAGQQLGQASYSLFGLYERKAQEANETHVQEFIGSMQDVLRTGPNAFSKLEGADAIQAAGAATETLKNLTAEVFEQAANG